MVVSQLGAVLFVSFYPFTSLGSRRVQERQSQGNRDGSSNCVKLAIIMYTIYWCDLATSLHMMRIFQTHFQIDYPERLAGGGFILSIHQIGLWDEIHQKCKIEGTGIGKSKKKNCDTMNNRDQIQNQHKKGVFLRHKTHKATLYKFVFLITSQATYVPDLAMQC
jgi:hypothetical protein